MEFIDLAKQRLRIKDSIGDRIQRVLEHGQYIMGPEVQELEQRLAEYVGVRHAVACASGTDGLLLALMAHTIGPGHAIFTSPFSFIAAAEVIGLLGATPVFVDIDPRTFNMDPGHLFLAITAVQERDPSVYPLPRTMDHGPRTTPKGIIAVDLFGLPAEYDPINALARDHGLFVIEDAAQSFGATSHGEKACALAGSACTSFYPAKPLGCYGDGGMCFTGSEEIARSMRSLRHHGAGEHPYDHARIGINGRLDTLQAAILLAKLEIFREELDFRQQVAQRYTRLLAPCFMLRAPCVPETYRSAWAQYSVLAEDTGHRSRLRAELADNGIPTAIHYPKPLHLQGAFGHLGYREGDFPVSEAVSRRIFSLPMHPYLEEEDQRRIVDILLRCPPA